MSETTDDEKANLPSSENVDNSVSDQRYVITISDALSEKDKVKFTIRTQINELAKPAEVSVIREHAEFLWLHESYTSNPDYAGMIIPPAPSQPNFDSSRTKLQKLTELESTFTKTEYDKIKQELEIEYLAMFKKTVNVHEVFLKRLALSPVFSRDPYFKVFLTYSGDLNVRTKNKKEQISEILKSIAKSADELYLANYKDVDEYFDHRKAFLTEYCTRITEATRFCDKFTKICKAIADSYIQVSVALSGIATVNRKEPFRFLEHSAAILEKVRKVENRTSADFDLKLSDTLRYYSKESRAAVDLLYRRSRMLADYEAANRNLDRCRAKNKDLKVPESEQNVAKAKFDHINTMAKIELEDFGQRRVKFFKESLVEFAEIQIKHSKKLVQVLMNGLQTLSGK